MALHPIAGTISGHHLLAAPRVRVDLVRGTWAREDLVTRHLRKIRGEKTWEKIFDRRGEPLGGV